MPQAAIEAHQLGKSFQIGRVGASSQSLSAFARSFRDSLLGRQGTAFWALQDLDFQIMPGEVVGFIGRNGAGKSTLLKLISRITRPTTGKVVVRGRLSSLLEVGTGFHPELSGRENIYLNGSILGMNRQEIAAQFDEIVAFAGVERFLDTPVKRYSSGMYVRLGFAIAAHLQPDVLVIDEVLAVGDLAFQRKCLGKMEEVAGQGRTVLFVSHQMQSVRGLCTRGIWLQQGKQVMDGPVHDVADAYEKELRNLSLAEEESTQDQGLRRGDGKVRFTQVAWLNAQGEVTDSVMHGQPCRLRMRIKVQEPLQQVSFSAKIWHPLFRTELTTWRYTLPLASQALVPGSEHQLELNIPEMMMRPGAYPMYLWLGDEQGVAQDVLDQLAPTLEVGLPADTGNLPFLPGTEGGSFSLPASISLA